MKVILQQDVRGQGKKGQMIDAAEGYARNYLLPRKLAIPATADAINTMNLKEKARRAEEAANRAAAVETADKLRNCTVKITAKGGANGKLFGAITYSGYGTYLGTTEQGMLYRFQLRCGDRSCDATFAFALDFSDSWDGTLIVTTVAGVDLFDAGEGGSTAFTRGA